MSISMNTSKTPTLWQERRQERQRKDNISSTGSLLLHKIVHNVYCSVQCVLLLCSVYYLPVESECIIYHPDRAAIKRESLSAAMGPYTTLPPNLNTLHCIMIQCAVMHSAQCTGIWPACLCQGFAVKMSVIGLLKCPYSLTAALSAVPMSCTVHYPHCCALLCITVHYHPLHCCHKLLCAKFMAEQPCDVQCSGEG